jgi:hypothetical protein
MCLFFGFFTQIVPCNVRLEFNELITEDTMIIHAPRGPYTMEVHKGRKISQIGGDEWNRFIAHMHLTGGELISFSFRRQTPRLAVIYINNDEDDDPLDEPLYAKESG